jgi:predicted nucleic acid-binding protein
LVERHIAYVDTSLLVKRYLAEPDSSAAIALLESLDIVTSMLSVLEITSALHAASRAHLISPADLERLLSELDADRDTWGLLSITSSVLQRARAIVGPQALRSLDAIHCASAALYRDDRGKPVAFATLDRRQRDAADALGFECLQLD